MCDTSTSVEQQLFLHFRHRAFARELELYMELEAAMRTFSPSALMRAVDASPANATFDRASCRELLDCTAAAAGPSVNCDRCRAAMSGIFPTSASTVTKQQLLAALCSWPIEARGLYVFKGSHFAHHTRRRSHERDDCCSQVAACNHLSLFPPPGPANYEIIT